MARSPRARVRVEGLQPVQILAGLIGLVFLVAGIVGFTRTGFGNFTGHHDETLWRFGINPFHNLLSVVTGLVGLVFALSRGLSRFYGLLLLVGYGALFVWGLMISGTVSGNPVSRAGNPFDLSTNVTWLHLGVAVLGLIVAMLPARKIARVDEPEPVRDEEAADDLGGKHTTEQHSVARSDVMQNDVVRNKTAAIDPPTQPVPAQPVGARSADEQPTDEHATGPGWRPRRWTRHAKQDS
ncbi:DUF4383 domain-containing protein [Amycolatopsis sp. H20-H5]|uniref:DUF4383 domain-containing protein n=1 Tax=Amycolatopsis sp. H20-H5 TaxID=3046309 RepID=UPI002DBE8759|nr:DUF4383 domain-containing protein [Amycolatopsis sp. H20-H5]MEC3974800.1 DUF4383 domain-containing protein [Amycolatopsis sp. H20-H5]